MTHRSQATGLRLRPVRLFWRKLRRTPLRFCDCLSKKRSLFPLIFCERAKIPTSSAQSGVSELSGIKLPSEENGGALSRRLGWGS